MQNAKCKQDIESVKTPGLLAPYPQVCKQFCIYRGVLGEECGKKTTSIPAKFLYIQNTAHAH